MLCCCFYAVCLKGWGCVYKAGAPSIHFLLRFHIRSTLNTKEVYISAAAACIPNLVLDAYSIHVHILRIAWRLSLCCLNTPTDLRNINTDPDSSSFIVLEQSALSVLAPIPESNME